MSNDGLFCSSNCLLKSWFAVHGDSNIHELYIRFGDAGVKDYWFGEHGFLVAFVGADLVWSYHHKVAAAKYVMEFHRRFLIKKVN